MKTPRPPAKQKFFIDELDLTVRNVKYTDRSLPVPVDRTVDVKINHEIFRGITSFGDIVRLILMKVVYDTSFAALGAPVDFMKQQFGSSLLKGQVALTQGAELARMMGTQALGEGKKLVEQAAGKIQATVPLPPEVNQMTEEVKGKAAGLFKGAERFLKSTTDTLAEKVGDQSD